MTFHPKSNAIEKQEKCRRLKEGCKTPLKARGNKEKKRENEEAKRRITICFLKRTKEEKRSKKHFNSYQFDLKKRLFKHKKKKKIERKSLSTRFNNNAENVQKGHPLKL